jgi:hypothetical protein
MVSPLIPIAFSQEKIMELENKDYNVKIEYPQSGNIRKVISNQVILIHILQYSSVLNIANNCLVKY